MNVQLVAKTTGVGKYEELNSEEIVSAIARHGIIKEDNGKLIKYLMDNKHVSRKKLLVILKNLVKLNFIEKKKIL